MDDMEDDNMEHGVYCENGDVVDVVMLAIDSKSLCFHDRVPNEEDNDHDDIEGGI